MPKLKILGDLIFLMPNWGEKKVLANMILKIGLCIIYLFLKKKERKQKPFFFFF